jgi:hypothetical protein
MPTVMSLLLLALMLLGLHSNQTIRAHQSVKSHAFAQSAPAESTPKPSDVPPMVP